MHAVMQWGWAHAHILANPISVFAQTLPKQNAKKKHQTAMPWRNARVAAFKQGEATRGGSALSESDGSA